ncbi:MAG: PqqD family protein [bacterium]
MEKECPIFKKENLLYEREEKEGYWTIIPKFHPETQELVINHTSRKILELCDGKRDIEGIVDGMKDIFPTIAKEKIQEDVNVTLKKFSRLLIIEWIGENPFLYKREALLSGDQTAMIAQENDILRIKRFIEKSNLFQDDKEKDANLFLYKDPFISSPSEYEGVSLRAKLFHFIEDFFLLEKGSEISGLISIALPVSPRITSSVIRLIIAPRDSFSELLRYAQDNLPFISLRKVTKLRIQEATSEKLDPELERALLNEDYKEEGIMKDELDFSNSLRMLVRYYSEAFIEKIEHQRVYEIEK